MRTSWPRRCTSSPRPSGPPRPGVCIAVSQSGETIDTLEALRYAQSQKQTLLSVVNVPESAIARLSHVVLPTLAGPEIGVASTKAFTSQLVALQLLALYIAQARGTLTPVEMRSHIEELLQLPHVIEQAIRASAIMERVADKFYSRRDFLFLGRGLNYPIALEGALKLKEISYIHAEGYPAGEMKHGPIALIDENMPVVAIAPDDAVFEKMLGNVQEAKARGGTVIAVTSEGDGRMSAILDPTMDVVVPMPRTSPLLTPIVMTIPLQLLAYYIAVRRGCDVDQPRNLAKSVTVE